MLPTLDLQACAATGWQATPDLPLRLPIAIGLVALAGASAARRRFPGQRAFVAMCGVMAVWLAASLAEHAAVDAACKGTLALLGWAPIAAQPPLYALFLHQYLHSEQPGAGGRGRWLLALPSVALVAAAWTNGAHGLWYGSGTTLGPPVAGLPRLRFEYGPLFYAAVGVGYSWLAWAALLMLRGWSEARGRLRRHWGAFLVMMAVPVAANVVYLGFGVRLLGADPTGTAFAVAVAGFAWLIARDRMFDAVPLARRLLFDELPDPVLVLDAQGCIAEANGAARRLVPPPPLERPLADWPRYGPALAAHAGAPSSELALADPPGWYEVQRRALGDPAAPLGTLLQLHDVSARHLAHAATVRTLAAREHELHQAELLQAMLREQAMHDPLTGLLNRRALGERFALADADGPLALVLLDLDHFKRVNDTHGHAVGDAVLRDFGHALRSGLRADDALFRIGGEEFALLLPGAGPDQALARVEDLRRLVAGWRLGQLPGPIGFSAGVAGRHAGRATLEALLAAADAALYAAKHAGRGRTVCADDAPPPHRAAADPALRADDRRA